MSGMDCVDFVELVTAFLDGALDEDTERRFVDHIAECPGCERYLEQIRTTIDQSGRLTPESLSPQARDRLLEAFRNWDGAGM